MQISLTKHDQNVHTADFENFLTLTTSSCFRIDNVSYHNAVLEEDMLPTSAEFLKGQVQFNEGWSRGRDHFLGSRIVPYALQFLLPVLKSYGNHFLGGNLATMRELPS